MNLVYAVERLLETGWYPMDDQIERLEDGRMYPTLASVRQEFARAGLDLSLQHNPKFGCYRAAWSPSGDPAAEEGGDDRYGTVIGSCEREAAVYALAQLRESRQLEEVAG